MVDSAERFSPLVDTLHNAAASGWDTHDRAQKAVDDGEEGIIILTVGDPDLPTPEPVVERAVSALREGDTRYAPTNGREDLRNAIAVDVAKRTGLDLDADNVIVTAGTQAALFGASLCLLGHGDEVVAFEPVFLTYVSTLTVGGADLVRVPKQAEGMRPDIDALAAAITPRTRVLILTNPNNPTGIMLTSDELAAIADLAIAHDLWVLSDEVYCDMSFGDPFVSIASLPGMAERTVIAGALSKSHAMTGWRIGWAVGPKDLIKHINGLHMIVSYGVPGFVQQAGLLALTTHRDASEGMRLEYLLRRDLAVSILQEIPEITVLTPDAGMYVVFDVSAVAESSAAFCDELYEEKKVVALDAGLFGSSIEGWVRLAFTVGEDELAEGCRRIAEIVRERVTA